MNITKIVYTEIFCISAWKLQALVVRLSRLG